MLAKVLGGRVSMCPTSKVNPASTSRAGKSFVLGYQQTLLICPRGQAENWFSSAEAFGVVSLILAAVGIDGIPPGSVTEGMREIGVRVALGASRDDILG